MEFSHYGETYTGSLHITEFKKLGYGYIPVLSKVVHIGDEFYASIVTFQEKHENWSLQLLTDYAH